MFDYTEAYTEAAQVTCRNFPRVVFALPARNSCSNWRNDVHAHYC